MPKVSFRMASPSRESVFGVQTSTARKIHRTGHTEGRLTTAPGGCCVRKGTPCGRSACIRGPFPVESVPRVLQHPSGECPDDGAPTDDITRRPAFTRERARRPPTPSRLPWTSSASAGWQCEGARFTGRLQKKRDRPRRDLASTRCVTARIPATRTWRCGSTPVRSGGRDRSAPLRPPRSLGGSAWRSRGYV